MNLKNWFNFKYLWQNIKKSKSIIILILTIVPIISAFSMIAIANDNSGVYVPGLIEISILTIILLFIVPIILSISLFGYVFKKKSVDFVGSMPISRRSVFISNTIGGILIILLLLLLNALAMYIGINVFTDGILIFEIVVDYLILWSVVYIFMFALTNVAMSLSGNAITQIIVTILLIFFVPFFTDYTLTRFNIELEYNLKLSSEEASNIEYYCYGEETCEKDLEKGMYPLYLNRKDSSMHNYIYSLATKLLFGEEESLFDSKIIIYTGALTIGYLFLGYYLFKKRKMEVCETTFKTYKTHTFVKCLTLAPFVILFYELVDYSNIDEFWLFIFATLIIGYYYVYDLITKKGIQSFKRSIKYFVIFILITIVYFLTVCHFINEKEIIELNDVQTVSFETNGFETTEIKDREIINKTMIQAVTDSCLNGSCYYGSTKVKINNKYYEIYFNYSEYFIESIRKDLTDKGLESVIKEVSYDNLIAIELFNKAYPISVHKNLVNLVKNQENNIDFMFDLRAYSYQNHNLELYDIPITDKKVANYTGVFSNNKVINSIKNNDDAYYNIYSLDTRITYEYTYLFEYFRDEILEYYKNKETKDFDSSKDYIVLAFEKNHIDYWYYFDNDVEGLFEFLNGLKKQIKDLPEYLEYLSYYTEKVVD